jgi:hypothetical protein
MSDSKDSLLEAQYANVMNAPLESVCPARTCQQFEKTVAVATAATATAATVTMSTLLLLLFF